MAGAGRGAEGSFRRFIGLPLSEAIPDHATLWRFREAPGKRSEARSADEA
ncbi:MAG TPA: transposase [Rhizomicrobium sp.]